MSITHELQDPETHSGIGNRLPTKPINHSAKALEAYDYLAIFIKSRAFIIGLTFTVTFLTWAGSFLLPKIYNAKTVISLGNTQAGISDSVNQIQVKIMDVYSRVIFTKDIPKGIDFPKVNITFPKATSLMIINVSHHDPALALSSLERINAMLIEDHSRQAETARAQLENRVYNGELDLQSLRNQFKLMEADWKNGFTERNNKVLRQKIALEKLMQEKEGMLDKTKIFESNKQILTNHLDAASQSLRNQNSPKNNAYTKEKNALPMLVLSNEFEKNQRYKDDLENKINLEIPIQDLEIKQTIRDKEHQIEEGKLLLSETISKNDFEEMQYKDGQTKYQSRIKAAEQDLVMQKLQIKNMVVTTILLPPTSDNDPIFPNRRNIFLLSFFGAFFLSLLITIFREGWSRH